MSEIKVNSIKGVSASVAALSINNTDGTCTANITNNLSNKNLIINGACLISQRGTSSTSSGYQTVDRIKTGFGGTDEAPTQAQVDLSSSDTPYSSGFRKAFKVTNGNQTSGAGASDYLSLSYTIEAQDIANSGWNYTDANSKLTIQFWAKSSVAKTFILSLYTQDGTDYGYNHKYALAANTWTKITHTFSGNSNLTFDNDNGVGIQFQWIMFTGTTYTSGSTVDQWVVYNGYTSTPDDTSDWWTTNDATFELTGIQLEVGSVATDFEHLNFTDELLRCKRYYQVLQEASSGANYMGTVAFNYDSNTVITQVSFTPEMRATPTLDNTSGSNYYRFYRNGGYVDINAMNSINGMNKYGGGFNNSDSGSGTAGQAGAIYMQNTAAKIAFNAEL